MSEGVEIDPATARVWAKQLDLLADSVGAQAVKR
jgi:hypothetical protein